MDALVFVSRGTIGRWDIYARDPKDLLLGTIEQEDNQLLYIDAATDPLTGCHFAFNFEIRRVGCRKARFFALKDEMPIRFVRCSLILRVKAVLYLARYDRRWRANGLPCDRSGARRSWRTLSGPVSSPSQPAAHPCKRCLTFRGKNLDFIGKISHLPAKACP
ncbi:hypothetical protein [Microvirga guangxiensis]|uniref:hypothetical protein n=1 Tax=Microvirga guangxiensis TaxID=549386 RepID=UPI0011143C86|nr:hypothetical protein [Microvirga guangxiensis]